ncbi:MAG: hypothetical protein IJS32_03880 [Kiritimatiellae bacterium]|nr:hypothetical protein [Kiritimatiellia bacterium]
MERHSSIAAATFATLALSLKPASCARRAAASEACSAIQESYWDWSVCVKRSRVEERNMLVNALPLAKRTLTRPSANVTSKVLWLT